MNLPPSPTYLVRGYLVYLLPSRALQIMMYISLINVMLFTFFFRRNKEVSNLYWTVFKFIALKNVVALYGIQIKAAILPLHNPIYASCMRHQSMLSPSDHLMLDDRSLMYTRVWTLKLIRLRRNDPLNSKRRIIFRLLYIFCIRSSSSLRRYWAWLKVYLPTLLCNRLSVSLWFTCSPLFFP